MTITEVRPEAAAPAPMTPRAPAENWLTTTDHKQLGLIYLFFSLVFLIGGGVLAMLLRVHLAEPSSNILGDQYGRVFNAHAAIMTLLFLGPAWIGLATYLLPLQIGSGRLAFPRLHALAMWLYVVGGGILVASYIVGTPEGLGITSPVPLLASGPANDATNLWAGALIVIAVSTMLASTNLLATALALRSEGMTFFRMPAFSWSVMMTSLVSLLATPVFIAGLVLFLVDQHFGGTFYAAQGAQLVWEHMVWLFGRPEIYLLTLPGLGAACDIIATHTRRPLERHEVALGALAAFAILSMTAWMAGPHVAKAVVVPTYTVATALVVLPIGVLVLVWLNTARVGRPRFHASVLFIVGYVLLLATGAINALVAPSQHLKSPSAWTTGNLHTVALGAPVLLVFGAIYHWAPKLFGRRLSTGLGGLVFLLLFGGFFVNGMASYILGYKGAPSHVDSMAGKFQSWNRLGAAGGALVAIGVIVFVLDMLLHLFGRSGAETPGDPYEGLTLEWATSSPPPRHDFDTVPEVRSAAPLVDVREAEKVHAGDDRS
jgi:cytochrome c oxidase subunit 1